MWSPSLRPDCYRIPYARGELGIVAFSPLILDRMFSSCRQFAARDGDCGVRPRLSTFPVDKPFERLEPDAPISEFVFRLVVDLYSGDPVVVGSATLFCGHLLLTVKHVVTARQVLDGSQHVNSASPEVTTLVERGLTAVQVLPGPEYVFWDVVSAIAHPVSDLALLRVSSNPRRSDPESPLRRTAPVVSAFAPPVGERVTAFGYRRNRARASENSGGGRHIDIDGELMWSVGIVRGIYEWRRDDSMLPFPCYHVSARFDSEMSGGPVFDGIRLIVWARLHQL